MSACSTYVVVLYPCVLFKPFPSFAKWELWQTLILRITERVKCVNYSTWINKAYLKQYYDQEVDLKQSKTIYDCVLERNKKQVSGQWDSGEDSYLCSLRRIIFRSGSEAWTDSWEGFMQGGYTAGTKVEGRNTSVFGKTGYLTTGECIKQC